MSNENSSAKHTPGEWKIQRPNGHILIEAAKRSVAKIFKALGGDDAEGEANARLIAAAPELLANLKSLVGYEERRIALLEADNEGPLESLGSLKVELHEARAAIAKAEGRT